MAIRRDKNVDVKILIDQGELDKLMKVEDMIPSLLSCIEQMNDTMERLEKATKEAHKALVQLERARRRPIIQNS